MGLRQGLKDMYEQYSGALYVIPLPLAVIGAAIAITTGFVINMSDSDELKKFCPSQINSFLIASVIFAYCFVFIYGAIFALPALSPNALVVFFLLHIAHFVAIVLISVVVVSFLDVTIQCSNLLQYKFAIICIVTWLVFTVAYIGFAMYVRSSRQLLLLLMLIALVTTLFNLQTKTRFV